MYIPREYRHPFVCPVVDHCVWGALKNQALEKVDLLDPSRGPKSIN